MKYLNLLQKESGLKINSTAFLMCLLGVLLSTLLLGYAPSSIMLGVFFVFSIRHAIIHKTKIKLEYKLILPILLYLYFVASFFWSVDKGQTLKGLERMVALVIVPVSFIFLPKLSKKHLKIVLNIFTVTNVLLGIFFLINAVFNFYKTRALSVFTYHELVSVLDLNAIYVSLIFSISLFYLLSLKEKTKIHKGLIAFLLLLLFLLSSKLVIIIACISSVIFLFKNNSSKWNKKRIILSVFFLIALGITSSITLIDRFKFENESKYSEVLNLDQFGGIYPWTGSSIRLFQLRLLKEQIQEDAILLKGYGLFASRKSLDVLHDKYNTYIDFHHYNYHNQYAQILSELGLIGLIMLLLILFSIWSTGLKSYSFLVIMFSIIITLMFFTESLLWRQRGLFLFIVFYSLFVKIFENKIESH